MFTIYEVQTNPYAPVESRYHNIKVENVDDLQKAERRAVELHTLASSRYIRYAVIDSKGKEVYKSI